MRAPPSSFVAWEGPSEFTGQPIRLVITGLVRPSENVKTGPVPQGWIVRADEDPLHARSNREDAAICGDCAIKRACYVTPFGLLNLRHRVQTYPVVTPEVAQGYLADARMFRLGAYGDPAAIPLPVLRVILVKVRAWTSYTHAWRTCPPGYRDICMASVESHRDAVLAHAAGWRTFRIRRTADGPVARKRDRLPGRVEEAHLPGVPPLHGAIAARQAHHDHRSRIEKGEPAVTCFICGRRVTRPLLTPRPAHPECFEQWDRRDEAETLGIVVALHTFGPREASGHDDLAA